MKEISTILGLWNSGYFSDTEVIEWADAQILATDNDPNESLIQLSLKGPTYCTKLSAAEFPSPSMFSFLEQFSIKLAKVDIESEESMNTFISWVRRAAMGEDMNHPEVIFGYQLEDLCGFPLELLRYYEDNEDSIAFLKRNIIDLLPTNTTRLNCLLKRAKTNT